MKETKMNINERIEAEKVLETVRQLDNSKQKEFLEYLNSVENLNYGNPMSIPQV